MYNWEIVILMRKAIISIISVTFAFDLRSQGMLGLLATFVFCLVHAYCQPFIDPNMNLFEFISLLTSAGTFFFGIFTVDGGSSGAVVCACSSWLVGAISLAALVMLLATDKQM